MNIRVKRIFEKPDPGDGIRILVDRLWPRGLSKEKAKIDLWLKSVAPSNDLRKWYRHDPEKWPEFKERYFAELNENSKTVDELIRYIKKGAVTFLYSSKEQHYNNAVALKEFIKEVSE